MTDLYQLRWMYFSLYLDGAQANGYVYGNPNFPEGYHIRTSAIEGMAIEGDALIITTRNSRYSCPLEELSCEEEAQDNVRSFLLKNLPAHKELLSSLAFQRAADCPITTKNNELTYLTPAVLASIRAALASQEALPAGSYILCINICYRSWEYFSGVFKKELDGTIVLLQEEPYIHWGMFQDSVLCLGDENEAYDIRYFPRHNSIELYGNYNMDEEPSSEMPCFICNVGTSDITVNNMDLPPMGCYKVPDGTAG